MIIYWLLFAFPALMALAYPVAAQRRGHGALQLLGAIVFVAFYTLLGMLRYETGGDWLAYEETFEDIRQESLSFALTRTDPLFGLLNWVSAGLGTGIYLVNGVACLFLGVGTIRVAMTTREPWLAIMMAVPYLLIVVGMGYVRQGAAIGLILIAITTLDRSRPGRTIICLLLATGFHSTAAFAFPLFGYALSNRRKLLAAALTLVGSAGFVFVIAPQLNVYEVGYLEAEYDSEGAAVRLLMSLLPSLLLLARWNRFAASQRVRPIWVGMAVANIVAMAALLVTPSSTAVDRVGLYFAPVQMLVLGEIRDLTVQSDRLALLLRIACIALAAMVQTVWLVFATHAYLWVPYKSVLQFL
jgi:hypothetical protein